jgi:hypothetical protein
MSSRLWQVQSVEAVTPVVVTARHITQRKWLVGDGVSKTGLIPKILKRRLRAVKEKSAEIGNRTLI